MPACYAVKGNGKKLYRIEYYNQMYQKELEVGKVGYITNVLEIRILAFFDDCSQLSLVALHSRGVTPLT